MERNSIEKSVDKFVLSLEQKDYDGASSILQDEYINLNYADFAKFIGKAIQGTKDSKEAPDLYRSGDSYKVDDGILWDSTLMKVHNLPSSVPAMRYGYPELERASERFNKILEDHDVNKAKQAVTSLIDFAKDLPKDEQYELYRRVEAINLAQTNVLRCLPQIRVTFGDTDGDGKYKEAVRIRISETHVGRGQDSIRNIDLKP